MLSNKLEELQFPIIFEDEDIVVINKPGGVVVNRSDSTPSGTVQDWFEERYGLIQANSTSTTPTDPTTAPNAGWMSLLPDDFESQYGTPEEIFLERQGMVHRLDKDTSGALVFAKNPGSLVNMLFQFKKREVTKRYLCLTHGKFVMPSGDVRLPIGRRPDDRKRFGVVPDGRPAETEYRVLQYYSVFQKELLPPEIASKKRFELYQGFSLVECFPKTGRTHQIRVHLQHLQHPIVGDIQYAGKKRAQLDRLWCQRQFLHASELTFNHPRSGESVSFEANLPGDLQQAMQYIAEVE